MLKRIAFFSVPSYPKVNLALDILGKDESGYHKIQTVFHKLNLPMDEVVVQECDEDLIEVRSDNPKLPTDETNTVYKAAMLLKKQTGIKKGAKIFIRKKIPLMSGLGGGSSNAVAALKALAKFWPVDEQILRGIANQIGMDCQFFFTGGTALGEHFGEKITPILHNVPLSIKFEIIPTEVEISSKWAYEQISIIDCAINAEKTEWLIRAMRRGDDVEFLKNLHNDLEQFVFEKHPELAEMKKKIESEKPGKVMLCGSGGALVRIYSS
jgi:4-diphosphocytidyl-2-C-methyl-D-erythritol kinase